MVSAKQNFPEVEALPWKPPLLNPSEIKKVQAASEKGSTFQPSFTMPENPTGVRLNFDEPDSPEGTLKRMLLNQQAQVLAALNISADSGSSTVAVGMDCVGRCAPLGT